MQEYEAEVTDKMLFALKKQLLSFLHVFVTLGHWYILHPITGPGRAMLHTLADIFFLVSVGCRCKKATAHAYALLCWSASSVRVHKTSNSNGIHPRFTGQSFSISSLRVFKTIN